MLSNEIQSVRMYMLIFKDLLFSRIDTIEVQQWSMYSSLIAKKIGIVFFYACVVKGLFVRDKGISFLDIFLFIRIISIGI